MVDATARPPRLVLVLSENWTMTSPRDLRGLVRIAQEAEAAGIDGVMLSEHIVLGPTAGAGGRPENPRDYAAPGNQDPGTPWPDSIVLMSAIASVTSTLRLIGAAIIAPLRHPLLLAHQLATLDLLCEGRLVVQPTVSWHREEYEALGVPFEQRGELLDEQLAAWRAAWGASPASFRGRWYRFDEVYLEPKPYHPQGPRLWFGGSSVGPWIIRRLVEYGHGFHPFGQPSAAEMRPLVERMTAAGRQMSELEVVGGIRGTFPPEGGVADIAEAAEAIPAQLAAGYTTICFKPSQFTDDPAEVGDLCRRLVALSSR
ncbi:MAG TPA: TIGR03619 family F420-dependent LLM class oxidoreductase [Solirubrobacteraceae bacterium]|nr:TIGR03619 family F420-dependent LLM class oxidoreductase [Solirubrobacteraceae bacterium]